MIGRETQCIEGVVGRAGEHDDATYLKGLCLRFSSSIHRLSLALSSQGRAQCGKDVIHIICVKHNDHNRQNSKPGAQA